MKIPKVAKTIEEQKLKGLNYAVKKRSGYANHLRACCGAKALNEFITTGFVKTAETPEGYETYKITSAGNKHYKETYGTLNYYKARFIGLFEKIMGKI